MSLQNLTILAVKTQRVVARTLPQYATGRFKTHALILNSKEMGVQKGNCHPDS